MGPCGTVAPAIELVLDATVPQLGLEVDVQLINAQWSRRCSGSWVEVEQGCSG